MFLYNQEKILNEKCGEEGHEKLARLENPKVTDFIARHLAHCNPEKAFVRANAGEDAGYIRKRSVEKGEEIDLEKESHTVHFDGFKDQARDKENTKFLLPPEEELSPHLKSIEREEGLKEKHGLENIMEGREAYICFFSVSALKTQNFRFPPSK